MTENTGGSSPGMKFLVNVLEPAVFNMRVQLRCRYIRVPQHELYGPQISPVFQEMGGKGMPEGVWANLLLNARFQGYML